MGNREKKKNKQKKDKEKEKIKPKVKAKAHKILGISLSLLTVGVFLTLGFRLFLVNHYSVSTIDGVIESVFFEKIKKGTENQIQAYLGKPIWSVDLSALKDQIMAVRWIEDVRVMRWLPNELKVFIKPKKFVLNYLTKNNKIKPVALDGEFLPELELKEAIDLPIIKGTSFERDIKLRLKAIDLIESLPSRGLLTLDEISDITYQPRFGFEVNLINFRLKVVFGEGDFTIKALRVNEVLDVLKKENIQDRVIDARYSKKVVVRQGKLP